MAGWRDIGLGMTTHTRRGWMVWVRRRVQESGIGIGIGIGGGKMEKEGWRR